MRPIHVLNRQRRVKIFPDAVTALASFVLDAHNVPTHRSLSILFTNDATIQRYNAQFLNHNHPTDVISFHHISPNCLGDIVISAQRAMTYAAHHRISLPNELARYVIHGILHCLGYTDSSPPARRRMFTRQEILLARWLRRRIPICSPLPLPRSLSTPHH
ncbi:MAG: rRNA maturation RNase YbeY [bacterium]|nr:rRNA maturation RNase YbeY [bacterium]